MIDYAQIQRTALGIARKLPPWASVDADDLAHESIVAALRGRKSTDGPMKDLLRRQGWMKTFQRGGGCRRTELNERCHRHSPEAKWSASIDAHRLLSRISSPHQKQAIELRYLSGLRTNEIAATLNISAHAVECRIYKGLKNMRRFIR